MVLRSLCGLAVIALGLPLACGSSDGDSSETSGGAPGKGGTSGDAGSTADGGDPGSDGGTTGSGGTESGQGGAPGMAACAENDVTTSDCETVGSLCANAERCCRCLDFPSAPSCGSQWSCARPEVNSDDCPENPPTAGDPCTTLNVSCQYCDDDGPHFLFCGRIDVGSDEGEWNEGDGLSCNE